MKINHGDTEGTKRHRVYSVKLQVLCSPMARLYWGKNRFCYFILLWLFISCGSPKEQLPTDMVNIPATSSQGVDRFNLPVMKFEEEVFDFGTITQGEKVSHEFKFKNTGDNDLVISNAYADCGCTVAEVPRQPISSGGSNVIRVTFDSDKKTGIVNKSITILSNCMPNKQVIKIKVNIFEPQPKNQ